MNAYEAVGAKRKRSETRGNSRNWLCSPRFIGVLLSHIGRENKPTQSTQFALSFQLALTNYSSLFCSIAKLFQIG